MGDAPTHRRFDDGTVIDEDAVQALLDQAVDALAGMGAATGLLLRLRDPAGVLDDRQRRLAAAEARLVHGHLRGDAAATLRAVVEALAAPGEVRWGPGDGAHG